MNAAIWSDPRGAEHVLVADSVEEAFDHVTPHDRNVLRLPFPLQGGADASAGLRPVVWAPELGANA
jgi:hypothetical protein